MSAPNRSGSLLRRRNCTPILSSHLSCGRRAERAVGFLRAGRTNSACSRMRGRAPQHAKSLRSYKPRPVKPACPGCIRPHKRQEWTRTKKEVAHNQTFECAEKPRSVGGSPRLHGRRQIGGLEGRRVGSAEADRTEKSDARCVGRGVPISAQGLT